MSYNPYQSQPATQNTNLSNQQMEQQARSKLMAPGIALIVVGTLGLLGMGIYFALTVALYASGAPNMQPPPEMNEAERSGFYLGAYGVMFMMGLNTLFQIFIILGGVAMVRAKGHGMAFAGAVFSVVPCLSSSGCLLGIPFGIWALIVLADPNVKRVMGKS